MCMIKVLGYSNEGSCYFFPFVETLLDGWTAKGQTFLIEIQTDEQVISPLPRGFQHNFGIIALKVTYTKYTFFLLLVQSSILKHMQN